MIGKDSNRLTLPEGIYQRNVEGGRGCCGWPMGWRTAVGTAGRQPEVGGENVILVPGGSAVGAEQPVC